MSDATHILRGSVLFREVCLAEDAGATLRDLSNAELRALIGRIEDAGILSGIPGQVYGLAIVESSRRFMQQGAESRERGEAQLRHGTEVAR